MLFSSNEEESRNVVSVTISSIAHGLGSRNNLEGLAHLLKKFNGTNNAEQIIISTFDAARNIINDTND